MHKNWLVSVVNSAVQERSTRTLAKARQGIVMEQNTGVSQAQRDLLDALKEPNRLRGVDDYIWTKGECQRGIY